MAKIGEGERKAETDKKYKVGNADQEGKKKGKEGERSEGRKTGGGGARRKMGCTVPLVSLHTSLQGCRKLLWVLLSGS